jgi:uncharacterized protein involved in exopolysaccharide biosynthesis
MRPEQKNMDDLTIQRKGAPEHLSVTLRDVLMPVFRQRRLATMIFIGIFAGAVLSALLLPPRYEAEMKILVNQDRVDPVITSNADIQRGSAAVLAVSEEDLNSEVELLKSRDLLERVVLASGLESRDESRWGRAFERIENALWRTQASPQSELARSVQALEDTLVVDPLKKTKLIRVMYCSRDPELAARVLQNLGNLFQEKHAAVHRPPGTFPFFNQEAERYRGELAAAETQLSDFDGTEEIVSAAAQKQLVLQQLSQFQAELQQSKANAHEATQRALALKAQTADTPSRQTTQIIKTDNAELMATLETTLLNLELKRSDMLTKYAPTYQPVLELESQIADTQKAINHAESSPTQQVTTDRLPAQDWMATEVVRAETDRKAFEAQAGAIGGVVRLYQGIAKNLDEKGRRQDDLIRNVKIGEDNYLLYLRKREEARISDALDSKRIVNVAIAEAATVPALPMLNILWLFVGGFFTAGIVSVAAAYAVDRMDPSFRTPDELVRYLNVKVLASIPSSASDK